MTKPDIYPSDRALARALGVSASAIGQWRKRFPEDAPKTRSLKAWTALIEKHGLAVAGHGESGALSELRAAKLAETLERVKRLKRENEWGDGALVKRSEMDERDQQIALRQKTLLYSKMENELPVLLEGQDVVTIRRKLRDTADEICGLMQELLAGYEYSGPPRVPNAKSFENKLTNEGED